MIPRHRPPFSLGDVFRALFSHSKKVSIEQIEEISAIACGVPAAVLLPSARAGICWGLRAAISHNTIIIGAAYNCEAVHEAMVRSGGRVKLIDTDENSFLMDTACLATEQTANHAVVLSEIYGYPYDSRAINGENKHAPRIRIIDTAMSVPVPQLFNRLENNDFGVTSFGLGKCIYAGWGGIGMTRDISLADEVRAQRNARVQKEDLLLLLRRGSEILFRTMAHARVLYGTLQRFRKPPTDHPTFPSTWSDDTSLSKEWYSPSTNLDRQLIRHNLERRCEFWGRRLALASRYHENLRELQPTITLPPISSFAMSHYTIRVPAKFRNAMQAALWRLGVDTGILFRVPVYLSNKCFPNAIKTSSEVLNLPLDACLTDDIVDYICDCVIRSTSRICSGALD